MKRFQAPASALCALAASPAKTLRPCFASVRLVHMHITGLGERAERSVGDALCGHTCYEDDVLSGITTVLPHDRTSVAVIVVRLLAMSAPCDSHSLWHFYYKDPIPHNTTRSHPQAHDCTHEVRVRNGDRSHLSCSADDLPRKLDVVPLCHLLACSWSF